jgi:hypothetical protein
MWTRAALEDRVAALAERHEGEELVAAVRELSEQLDDGERELLGRVLLARASYDYALMRQVTRRKWGFFTPKPQEPGRGRSSPRAASGPDDVT